MRKTLIFALGIYFTSGLLSCVSIKSRNPSSEDAHNDPPSALRSIIQDESGTPTISKVLAKLKASQPNLFKQYSLAYQSKSLHGTSFANPRAILYGEDAALVVTFNGSPKQKGYAALEVMEFEPRTGKYFFQEYLFKADVPDDSLSQNDFLSKVYSEDIVWENLETQKAKTKLSFENLPGVLTSQKNPARCAQCHGAGDSAAPIWDNYFLWPGIYGSDSDHHTFMRARGGRALHYPSNAPSEAKFYADFMRSRDQNPRYQWLAAVEPLDKRQNTPNENLTRLFLVQSMVKLKWKILSLFDESKNQNQSLKKLKYTLLRTICELPTAEIHRGDYTQLGSKFEKSFQCEQKSGSVCEALLKKKKSTYPSTTFNELQHNLKELRLPFEQGVGYFDEEPNALNYILANIYDIAEEPKNDFNYDLFRRNDLLYSNLARFYLADKEIENLKEQIFMMLKFNFKINLSCQSVRDASDAELKQTVLEVRSK